MRKNIDKFGATTSILCLIHCMLMPFFMTIIPIFGTGHNHLIEVILIGIAFLFGGISIWNNWKRHKIWKTIPIFILGFSLLIVSHETHIIGAILVLISHWINYKTIKKLDGCHPHNCRH
jgi:asparagine N-glycosylation enzyme membrane subunit Stt3